MSNKQCNEFYVDNDYPVDVKSDIPPELRNKNPFSVYAIAQKVFIDGNLMFDRDDSSSKPVSDFDLGIIKPNSSRTQ